MMLLMSGIKARGFKKATLPLDSGYVRPRKDGGRDHKQSPAGHYHVDSVDPERDPIGHIVEDVVLRGRKR